jgi:hypothetical protein
MSRVRFAPADWVRFADGLLTIRRNVEHPLPHWVRFAPADWVRFVMEALVVLVARDEPVTSSQDAENPMGFVWKISRADAIDSRFGVAIRP